MRIQDRRSLSMNLKHGFSVGSPTLFAIIMAAVLTGACSGGAGGSVGATSTAPQNVNRCGSCTLTQLQLPVLPNPPNVVPILIDAGPVSGSPDINVAFVSVTVCAAGSTSSCQTIDHVQLDTGSSGLRLLNSALSSSLNLQPVTNGNGAIGECMAFADGNAWGSVQTGDVYLGGEFASSVPIQIIGDKPGGVSGVPSDCASYGTGSIEDTQAQLGANGILGVGPFTSDCADCQNTPYIAAYYTCTIATGCSGAVTPQVVSNPVALFSQDNNGVVIQLPAISSAGETNPCPASAAPLPCTLTLGIGTSGNNQLGLATVYAVNSSGINAGDFSTSYNGGIALPSYIDSGSNALFFNDSTIPVCPAPNSWVYCPTKPSQMAPNAINSALYPSSSTGVAVTNPAPTIANADQLFSNNVVAGNIGGPYGQPSQFAWGLPFFFGRTVFTGILGVTPPPGVPAGPYFAY